MVLRIFQISSSSMKHKKSIPSPNAHTVLETSGNTSEIADGGISTFAKQ